jgi:hypothetical protein
LNKQLAKANETAIKYNDTAQQYKEQWDKFGKQMVDATDKLDPLVLKEMFQKNERLETANADLQKQLSNVAAGGSLLLDVQQLALRVVSFKGDLGFRAVADPGELPVNQIGQVEYRSTNPTLGITFDGVAAFVNSVHPQLSGVIDVRSLPNIWLGQQIDALYSRRVSSAFTSFLSSNAYESPKERSA